MQKEKQEKKERKKTEIENRILADAIKYIVVNEIIFKIHANDVASIKYYFFWSFKKI